ncbi:MAG: hypothetical protein AAB836_00660 [Patescibacteria group bacterium]
MLDEREPIEYTEYTFNEGVQETVKRIADLMLSQDYVVASVEGPASDDISVGKTTLSGAICQACTMNGIPFVSLSSLSRIDKHLKEAVDRQERVRGRKKCLILLTATGNCDDEDIKVHERYRNANNKFLERTAKSVGLNLEKIDLSILVYRPDRPIPDGSKISVDLIVRNEFAKDKIEDKRD